MRLCVDLILFSGLILAGATGRFLNGPWLLNKIHDIIPSRFSGKTLSPVIFSKFKAVLKCFMRCGDFKIHAQSLMNFVFSFFSFNSSW